MPQKLKLAVSQSRTLSTLKQTLLSLEATTRQAATQGVDLILFPEAFLGGYPRSCNFGAVVGSRTDDGREQYLQYFKCCVDLGDTPRGAGDDWIDRKLPVGKGAEYRGDGTREFLERVARETGVFVVTGLVEKSGGSLYCAVVYVCPRLGCLGASIDVTRCYNYHQGREATAGVSNMLGEPHAAARYSLYSQNVNLWLAPTADARDTWWPLMRTIGNEGRCFVLSSITCVKRKNLPSWIDGPQLQQQTAAVADDGMVNGAAPLSPRNLRRRSTLTIQEEHHELVLPTLGEDSANASEFASSTGPDGKVSSSSGPNSDPSGEEFACRGTMLIGGSCIAGPMGQPLVKPLWEVEDGGLLIHEADFEDCERGRLDLDVAGSYSRNDAFHLTVEGLDITPPP